MLRISIIQIVFILCLQGEVRFNRDILPILSDACFKCHGPDSATREANLRLDSEESAKEIRKSGTVIVPNHPEKSLLLKRIHSSDPDKTMPPPASSRSLSKKEKNLLSKWIKEGAKWEQHWAFVKPTKPSKPNIKNPEWTRNSIDYFISAELERRELQPSQEASKRQLIRRVTFDLTGLPPTLSEVEKFLSDDRENAYEQLVDRLLSSPRYGETMALPWLEAARFADTDGYQFDGPRHMWRWRDWVIEAFNSNKKFDDFTIEQLAGDLLPDPSLDQLIATGFNRNHRYNSEAGLDVDEFLLENAVDRVDTTSTVWLGLTIGCARCHDHKYDPVSQKEYYQLISFFNNIPEFGRAVKAGNSEPYIVAPTKPQQKELASLASKISQAKNKIQRQLNSEKENLLPPDPLENIVTHKLTYQHPGESLEFDGTKSIKIPDTPISESTKTPTRFQVLSPLDRYSISLWINPSELKSGTIVSRQSNDQLSPGINLQLQDGRLRYTIITRWIAGVAMVETEEPIPLNRWTHLALSFHGQLRATNQKIFINGKEAPLKILHNTNSNTGSAKKGSPLVLGGVKDNYFRGSLHDVRIYQRPLKTREILALADTTPLTKLINLPKDQRNPAQEAKFKTAFLEQGGGKETYTELLAAEAKHDQYVRTLPTTMVMKENPTRKKTFVRNRGVYDDLGEAVERGVPKALHSFPAEASLDRLGFARWLVSPENPLTARVTVNRYWQRYFGVGLVKTSEDFGVQSAKPSHPKLLDWLATEFIRSDWDVKKMQKLIVTSATYRQDSRILSSLLQMDPENRLLARGPRERLSGHVIRDQALALSGLLVEKIGGPSVSPYQPKNLWVEMSMGMKYQQAKGDDLYRRSLYTIWKRTVNPPSMAILDAADREACWVGVKRTNTPLQALLLLNETTFIESARKLAERILREHQDSPIESGFRLVTQRNPTPDELRILNEALTKYRKQFQSDPDAAQKLIAIGESPKASDLDPIELAALTTFSNVLLNLDEVITKE